MHMLSANVVVVGRSTSTSGLPVGRWYHGWLNLRWLAGKHELPAGPALTDDLLQFVLVDAWECSLRHPDT